MNFLKVFLTFLFLGVLLLLNTDMIEASQWGPNCSSAPADHQTCPSGNTPSYATSCIDSVNIVGGVVQYGLTPAIGNITVTVKAAAEQLVCESVQCLRREDTKTITLTPNNSESNPAPYDIDTLGCSGGSCNDGLIISIVSINKGRYTSCTSLDTATGRLAENGQTIYPSSIHVRCTAPAPTSTPTPTMRPKSPPCPIPSGLIGAGGNYGDVDRDGMVTPNDIDKTSRIAAGMTATQAEIEAADVNGAPNVQSAMADVTSTDTALISQYLNGIVPTFTFPVCEQPTQPTNTPTPTLIPNACNVTCTRDADCTGSQYSNQNQCGFCLPDGSGIKTCQAPPTATPTGAPSPTITNTPPPTATPTQVPSPTSTPIPPPTSTPTPSFNPAACKCDGIEYTTPFLGQPITITSYGKVEGADVSKARIVDQKFFFAEGAETIARIIGRSDPIASVVVSSTPQKVRFQSKWTFTLPQLKSGATYRIWSQVNCQPTLQALNYTPSETTVLGTTIPPQPKSFIDRMIEFLNNLFSGKKAATTTSAPTPTSQAGTGAGMILEEPTPTGKKSLQLEPIYPLEVYQKTCSFIKFRSGFN